MAKPSLPHWQIAEEQLDSGHHWTDPVVTYSFPGWNADPAYPYGGFSVFSYDQQEMAKLVLDLWSDVADISFAQAYNNSSEKAQIRFFNSSELPFAGQAAYPGDEAWEGDVHINPYHQGNLDKEGNFDTSFGGGALITLLHEVGHALGLSHPGDYDGDPENPANVPTYLEDAEYLEDSRQYTVMSYFDAAETGAVHENAQGAVYAATPLLHDIYAIQQIYGANLSTRAGDTVYGYNSTADRDVFDFEKNPFPVVAIWDAGGTDTLDLSGERYRVRLDLNMGAFSDTTGLTMNVAVAYGTQIENAIGGDGDDTIVGNDLQNVLHGGDGDDEITAEPADFWTGYAWAGAPLLVVDDADELYGEGGNDTLKGGWGDDLLHGGNDIDDLNGGAGDDEMNGGAGADFMVGDAGVDTIHGGSGSDIIYGHRWWYLKENPDDPDWAYAETDYLYGGDGGDTIYGGFGDDWIWGDGGQDDDGELNHGAQWTGDDKLFGEEGNDTIQGGDGNDNISGGDDADYLYGEDGDDTISGGRHRDFLYGDAGNDLLHGDPGNDELRGGTGADKLWGSTGEDHLYGEDDNDWLHGGADRDLILHGGAGIDTASYYDETDKWTVDLANGLALNQDANYDEILVSIENLELGSGNDTAYGTNGANEIWGGAGIDTIEGRNGKDTLHGDAGVDTLRGGQGDDLIDPGADNDFVFGDNGNDTLTYAWTELGVRVDLAQHKASGEEIGTDSVQGVENAIGGAGHDRLYGDGSANRLDGGIGNDTLVGLAGNDQLIGGVGADRLMPGFGNDTVDGGRGTDTVDYSDTALNWTIELATSSAETFVPFFGGFDQTLIDIENVTVGSGDDWVRGDGKSNTVTGNAGEDYLHGGDGDDTLYGGEGDDTLLGDSGADRLFGGSGSDTFVFYYSNWGADTVRDFEDGVDRIDLSGATGVDSFDDLTIQDNNGDAVILVGSDSIVLAGIASTALDNSDFLLL